MATKKKTRRQYGTGSVTQRTDGRWQGSFIANGKRVYVYGKSEADVKTRMKTRAREIAEEGAPAANISVRTTVKTWSETWSEMRRAKVRPKTYATDRSALNQWIVPTIGHRRLSDLTPADVRAIVKAQREAGISTSTMNRNQSTLTSMLRAAILEGHAVPRRVLDVERPALAVHDRTNMSVPESLAMLYVASHLPHGSRWAMAFLAGGRQAECLGLTWSAVNFELGIAITEWQLQRLPYLIPRDRSSGFAIPDGFEARQLVGNFHLTRPKTKKGYRVTPLPPAMVEALQYWREIATPNDYDLIWTRPDGRPIDDKADRAEFYAMQKAAKISHHSGRPYMVHEARHTTASELLEAGVSDHDATSLIGHSTILTTRGYQHPSQRAALGVLEGLGNTFQLEAFNTNQRQHLEALGAGAVAGDIVLPGDD